MTSGEFNGLVAVVTGGATGLGAAVAATLAVRGARVAVLDLDPRGVPDGMLGLQADMTDDASVRRAIDDVVAAFGGIDILVNNAGIGAQGTVVDNPDAEWHRVLDVNLLGIVRTTRAALPHLRASAHPAIVNMCSVVATVGLQSRALYSASKGAVLALTQAMAADYVGEGIRVNAVNPGTADTAWVDRMVDPAHDAADRARYAARQPHGRLVTAEEVAHAVAYLASPLAGSTTAVALPVDGGMQAIQVAR